MRWVGFLYSLLCIASLTWGAGSLGEKGAAFLRSGQYDAAIEAFQQAIRLDPTQAQTHFQLGNAYAELEKYDEAIAAYRQALQLQPGPSLAHAVHEELGAVYIKTGQNAKAITAFEQARQLEPNDPRIYHTLGFAYRREGRQQEAEAAFHTYLRLARQRADQPDEEVAYVKVILGGLPAEPFEPQTYRLTVDVRPPDSQITWLNHDAKYQPGMRLAPGRYDLLVQRPGHQEARREITIAQEDVTIAVALDVVVPLDTAPPAIAITSYDVSQPVQVSALTVHTTVRGTVRDESQITQVTVNETAVEIDRRGQFEAVLMLEEGSNTVEVSAIDEHQNLGRTAFTIHRLSMAEEARRRFALVVGNSNYKVSPLRNAGNDAKDMAQALERLGFAVVLLLDVDQIEMEHAIERFSRRLRQGGVGLFYYAGHGIQVDGQNFLIPIGAELPDVTYVKYKTVHLSLILERMRDAGNELNIIILDACRDNPFRSFGRSMQRGLASVQAARGSLIAYATGPGEVALDGREDNGVYTKHLLHYISQPQLSIEQMFKQVRIAVQKETERKQTPWETSSLLGDFYFAGQ